MEVEGIFFCCAHCASEHGVHVLKDRLDLERNSA
jgi:hypothetical protein